MILIAGLLVFCASLFITATLRPPNKPAFILSLYLLSYANIVLAGLIANSFLILNQQWVFISLHFAFSVASALAWQRTGKPSLWGPFLNWKSEISIRALRNWVTSDPALAVFASGMILLYGFGIVQIIVIPQNNMDSLSTHLSRIGFWLLHGSFFPWPTYLANQVIYPVNAQLQTYWTLLFLHNDRLVGIVQWLAAVASAVGVWGLAREMNYRRRQAAFAVLIYLGFPLILLQSTTTQTDLVTAASFVAAVYFLILGLKTRSNLLLTLSAISVGLGVGTKKSYLLLLLALGAIALLAFAQYGRQVLGRLVYWTFSLIVATSIFGAYIYVSNWQTFGHPLGSSTLIDTVLSTENTGQPVKVTPSLKKPAFSDRQVNLGGNLWDAEPPKSGNTFLKLVYNTLRLMYQAIDTSGLPRPLDGYAHKTKMLIAKKLFSLIGFEEIEDTVFTAPRRKFSFSQKNVNEENSAWFGPLTILLLFPAMVYETIGAIRAKAYLKLVPILGLLIFLPLETLFRPGWDPFQGRYFAPLVAICAPLMGVWFNGKKIRALDWVVVGFGIMVAAVTLLYNPAKPTFGKFADEFDIWRNDRIFIQTIQRKDERNMYYMVDKFVPEDATLGYYIPFFILDYPLFGEHFTRRLVPIVSPKHVSDSLWLRSNEIDYLLIPKHEGYPSPPAHYHLVGKVRDWRLYEVDPALK